MPLVMAYSKGSPVIPMVSVDVYRLCAAGAGAKDRAVGITNTFFAPRIVAGL